jgi:uncharacterized alkaline shock family protein YloU
MIYDNFTRKYNGISEIAFYRENDYSIKVWEIKNKIQENIKMELSRILDIRMDCIIEEEKI